MDRVHASTWHQRAHITGPSAVLVSIRFGKQPEAGPRIQRLGPANGDDAAIKFDVQRHVVEILAGVAAANKEHGGQLEVEAIQIVPDDYPSIGQAQHAAYLIAKYVLTRAR